MFAAINRFFLNVKHCLQLSTAIHKIIPQKGDKYEYKSSYDGKRIDRKRLETALMTFNFILSCANELNGLIFWFDGCETEITLNDVRRALRYVRRV